MGKIEKEALVLRRRGYLQNAVLGAVAVTGILALTMVAPNALQLLGGFGRGKKRFAEQARTAAGRLVQKGHVRFEEIDGRKFMRITAEGKRALERAEREALLRAGPPRQSRWDGRWRMVVFDIPEKKRVTRNSLRAKVESFGFLRMQNSVWVYPYDCEDLIALIKADLRIGKDVLYAIVEKIENDGWIRDHFGLKH